LEAFRSGTEKAHQGKKEKKGALCHLKKKKRGSDGGCTGQGGRGTDGELKKKEGKRGFESRKKTRWKALHVLIDMEGGGPAKNGRRKRKRINPNDRWEKRPLVPPKNFFYFLFIDDRLENNSRDEQVGITAS